jgi:hypothetical protein
MPAHSTPVLRGLFTSEEVASPGADSEVSTPGVDSKPGFGVGSQGGRIFRESHPDRAPEPGRSIMRKHVRRQGGRERLAPHRGRGKCVEKVDFAFIQCEIAAEIGDSRPTFGRPGIRREFSVAAYYKANLSFGQPLTGKCRLRLSAIGLILGKIRFPDGCKRNGDARIDRRHPFGQ